MIGKELRKARETAGLTQEEVAFRAGISREYLGQIERGQKAPTVHVFLRVCKAMKVSASQLLGRVERSM